MPVPPRPADAQNLTAPAGGACYLLATLFYPHLLATRNAKTASTGGRRGKAEAEEGVSIHCGGWSLVHASHRQRKGFNVEAGVLHMHLAGHVGCHALTA
eukprot:364790-Chlamydomonas_euryale.AAC.14